jgi:hypothetical protein
MDAEAELPVVHVGDMRRATDGGPSWRRVVTRQARAEQVGVHDVNAQIEVLRDVPLGARAEPPSAPVVVAAGGCHSGQAACTDRRAGSLR